MIDLILTLLVGVLAFFLGRFVGGAFERMLELALKNGHSVTIGIDDDINLIYLEDNKHVVHKLRVAFPEAVEPVPESETSH